jgi:hypothetical protein
MKIRIFPILAFSRTDEDFTGKFLNGTGFLINDQGHFYTAGHNFFKRERGSEAERLNCFALINGELIPTRVLFLEYDRDSDRLKIDFACGEIVDFNSLPNEITIDCNEPIALGYKVGKLNFEKIATTKWNEKEFHLYKVPISIGTDTKEIAPRIHLTFSNVLFYTTEPEELLDGLSGCPILHNDNILGVLVSDCFITKEYIDKKKLY